MKKCLYVLALAISAFVLNQCKEEETPAMRNVKFAFNASALTGAGGRAADLPDGASLWVSVEHANGSVVCSLEKLSILKFGDQYISEPLPLPEGNFNITDFLITDASNEVQFAIPKEGSELASLVEDPLPVSFVVGTDEVTSLNVEVVSIDAHQPEAFGYVSFNITVVETEGFDLSVFIPGENGGLELSSANALLIHDQDTLVVKYLAPAVNSIRFDADPDEFYTLVLMESAYGRYSRTFRIGELEEELEGNPLTVILEPAFTIVANPKPLGYPEVEHRFTFNLTTNESVVGNIHIDWGDGTSTEVVLPRTCNYCEEVHVYPAGGPYFTSFTGNLEAIESLRIYYDNDFSEIALKHLTELKDLGFGVEATPQFIDISHNLKLESLGFDITSITHIDLSKNVRLRNVSLGMNQYLTPEAANLAIEHICTNAIAHGTRDGFFTIASDWDQKVIGPVTPENIQLLRKLRDDYAWYVDTWDLVLD